MTGNIALDVVIGLIFVYTLYSLFTTTIVEIISTNFQFRAKNLGRAIHRMLDDDDKGVLATEFFKQPRIKYMASGWLKLFNKPSYLQARNFSMATIELLREKAKSTSTDLKALKAALDLDDIKDTQTGKFLLSLYESANNDIDKFKESLEQWFDDTMERVAGWYKKRMLHLTFIVGLVLVTLFNADTFQIVNKLSRDPKAREQYVEMASSLAADVHLTDTIFDMELRKRLLENSEIKDRFDDDSIKFANFVKDSVYANAVQARDLLYARMDSLYVLSNKSQSILSFTRKKSRFVYDSWMNFFGCLVTAIALSLGAPFWFDLLNRLMKLRTDLGKPATAAEEKQQGGK